MSEEAIDDKAAKPTRAELLEEEGEIAADYLEELMDIADIDGDIDIDVADGRAQLSIVCEDEDDSNLRTLVGRDGKTLGALQELVRLAVQTSTVAILGVAVFIVASVGGRALGGLLADHVGAGPKGRTPITPARALAGAFAVVGVGITVSGQHVPGGIAILPALAVIIAGVMTQFQQGLNGRVSARAGSSYATTLQNFLVGVIALVVFAGARVLLGFTQWQWPHDAPWWAWLGAPLGIAFIGLSAWATEHISVLVLGLMGIMGQLGAALVIDLLDPVAREGVGVRTVVGMVVTAAAAAMAARSGGRRATSDARS